MKNQAESVITVIFSKRRDEVLLIKRRDIPVWVLPGGGIEKNETSQVAALRETQEETGLTCKIARKIGEYTPVNKLAKLTHFYELEILDGQPSTGPETKDIRFFNINNLPKIVPPPYPEWIQDANMETNELIRKELKNVNYTILFKNLLLHPILVVRFILSRIGLNINT
ncbi:MAG: NUDIX domain-containing protein [Chlamydiae bacterium CG10_big_fil_rev_8_21_14_0_10_35_9]|nr:MAG: NUDIX domain-containing protein [Chlamydiae bacterium CG10_big_fil_rev_8_21_14_0_10_35_9]